MAMAAHKKITSAITAAVGNLLLMVGPETGPADKHKQLCV